MANKANEGDIAYPFAYTGGDYIYYMGTTSSNKQRSAMR